MMIGLMAALLIGPYQEKNPAEKWKIDFTLSLERKGGLYVFVVEGTTNLPPETVLRARVSALWVVDDFRLGKREDEEDLVWGDEGGQPPFRSFSPVGGKFREEVYRFVRKPFSIPYRARIHYEPQHQKPIIAVKAGDDDFSRHADLRPGTETDYAEELRQALKEVADDFVALGNLYRELREVYAAHVKKFDAEAWKKWRGPWQARVEIIEDRNQERYRLWAIWVEHQSKMYVGGSCDMLKRIAGAAHELLHGDLLEKPRIDRMLPGLSEYLEQAIDAIGIDAPLDPLKVGPVLKAYEKAIDPLRGPMRDRPDVLRKARREGIAALLDLPPLLENRKRSYIYVTEVGRRFARLVEALNTGSPEEIGAALAEHDTALAELKRRSRLD